jgi:peroxiredoxin
MLFSSAMKKLMLAVAVLGLAACGEPAGSRQAPDLVLQDLAGKTVSLASYRGKPVLVNFWATWCDTCRVEMPDLQALHQRLDGKGPVILGVSMDENLAAVPPFVKENKITFPILYSDRKVSAAYAVRGLPAAYLIDPEGRIARRWIGAVDARAVENDILALLK